MFGLHIHLIMLMLKNVKVLERGYTRTVYGDERGDDREDEVVQASNEVKLLYEGPLLAMVKSLMNGWLPGLITLIAAWFSISLEDSSSFPDSRSTSFDLGDLGLVLVIDGLVLSEATGCSSAVIAVSSTS